MSRDDREYACQDCKCMDIERCSCEKAEEPSFVEPTVQVAAAVLSPDRYCATCGKYYDGTQDEILHADHTTRPEPPFHNMMPSSLPNFNTDLDKGGVKFDAGKPRMDLTPPQAMLALGKLFGMGAEKYAERNWETGIDQARMIAAMERHIQRYKTGEDIDPDPISGTDHLIHIAWNALCLYELTVCGKIVDQRTKLRSTNDE